MSDVASNFRSEDFWLTSPWVLFQYPLRIDPTFPSFTITEKLNAMTRLSIWAGILLYLWGYKMWWLVIVITLVVIVAAHYCKRDVVERFADETPDQSTSLEKPTANVHHTEPSSSKGSSGNLGDIESIPPTEESDSDDDNDEDPHHPLYDEHKHKCPRPYRSRVLLQQTCSTLKPFNYTNRYRTSGFEQVYDDSLSESMFRNRSLYADHDRQFRSTMIDSYASQLRPDI